MPILCLRGVHQHNMAYFTTFDHLTIGKPHQVLVTFLVCSLACQPAVKSNTLQANRLQGKVLFGFGWSRVMPFRECAKVCCIYCRLACQAGWQKVLLFVASQVCSCPPRPHFDKQCCGICQMRCVWHGHTHHSA